MQVTKRIRDKSSNGNQDGTMGTDGGDSLPSTSTSTPNKATNFGPNPIVSPRKSIREYTGGSTPGNRPNFDENSFLLHKGRKSYLMIPISKALTWITKLSIYYHHENYVSLRLGLYFTIIIIAGLLNDYLLTSSLLPQSVLDFIETNLKTSKRNFLNLYFVKLGWAWTLFPLVALFAFTRIYYVKRAIAKAEQASKSNRRKKSVHFREPLEGPEDNVTTNKPDTDSAAENEDNNEAAPKPNFTLRLFWQLVPTLIRLTIATLIWYYSVEFFVNISNSGASCRFPTNSTIVPTVNDKNACKQQGFEWHLGFDISGHIFLMVFSTLIRIEELGFLLEKFDEFAEFRYLQLSKERSMNYATPYRFSFSLFNVLALAVLILMVVVSLVWDFMIVQTSLFYHTLAQKLAGFGWAVIAWTVTYKAMFVAVPALRLQVTTKRQN